MPRWPPRLVGSLWFTDSAPAIWRFDWIPAMGIGFGFWVDPLGRSLALLVCVLGVLTILYSSAYLKVSRESRGGSSQSAYYAYLLLLTGSVLGLAFSADLVQLYLFCELIDVAAFLLIGLAWRERSVSRSAGVVLLFTTLGGLALLVGVVLLGTAAGTFVIPELIERAAAVRASPYFPLALALVIVGAASKSAQFPFHVWLPHAMAAPTPVNAFTDGAAALGAGVFLLLRLEPLARGDPLWTTLLIALGLASSLVGGALAIRATRFKIVLAYSTVSQYGFMMAVVGFGGAVAVPTVTFFFV